MIYRFTFLDLWPYIIIALVFIVCYITRTRRGGSIIFVTLLLFSCLRYDVGWDYTHYVNLIETDNLERFEIFGRIILFIGHYFNFYPIAFAAFSFLTLGIVHKSINGHSKNKIISWLIYYSLPLFFLASLTTLRQSLATAIILYSYDLAKNRKYLSFGICIFVATLFHVSAIAGLLILLIVIYPLGKFQNMILLALSFFLPTIVSEFVVTYLLENNLAGNLEWYLNNKYKASTKIQYLYYLLGAVNFLFYDKLINANTSNKNFITIVNFGLIVFNLLSFEPVSALRISAFFLIFLIYLVPDYGYAFSRPIVNTVNGLMIVLFLALTFVYLFMYVVNYESGILEKASFLPYKFWFNNL